MWTTKKALASLQHHFYLDYIFAVAVVIFMAAKE